MRILIFTINFAPERSGIGPYSTGLARHLASKHEVTVITGVPHYPDWRVAAEYRRWRHEEHDGGVRVIRLSHFVPSEPSALGRAAYELSWSVRAAAEGLRHPADAVVAVVPALFGAHAAHVVARCQGAPFGVLVQDIMGTAAAQSGYRGGRVVSRLTTMLERSCLSAATSIATIHPKLAEELRRIGRINERPNVIYNWTHVVNRPHREKAFRGEVGWREDEVIALHSGNMGSKQNLEVVIDAAKLSYSEGRGVRFVLAGGGSQRRMLEHYAAGCPAITFLDSVDDDVYMNLLASADVLLVNERPGMKEMSWPSKLTSYLVAGRPIVAATDTGSCTDEFVRSSGGGVTCSAGRPAELLDAITKIAADPQLGDSLAASGHAFAQKHLSMAAAMASYDQWIDQLVSCL